MKPSEKQVIDRLINRMRAPRVHSKLAFVPTSEMEDGGNDQYREALEFIESEAVRLANPQTWESESNASFMFVGNFGTGKTRLAVKLMAHAYVGIKTLGRIGRIGTPLFIKAKDLGELRFSFSNLPEDDAQRLQALRAEVHESPFLVLDDIGRIVGYKGEEEFLERVIEHRYENELTTVVTASKSNFESQRLKDFLESSAYERVILAGESRRANG